MTAMAAPRSDPLDVAFLLELRESASREDALALLLSQWEEDRESGDRLLTNLVDQLWAAKYPNGVRLYNATASAWSLTVGSGSRQCSEILSRSTSATRSATLAFLAGSYIVSLHRDERALIYAIPCLWTLCAHIITHDRRLRGNFIAFVDWLVDAQSLPETAEINLLDILSTRWVIECAIAQVDVILAESHLRTVSNDMSQCGSLGIRAGFEVKWGGAAHLLQRIEPLRLMAALSAGRSLGRAVNP